MKVFIVDDSEIILKRLINMLSELKNIEVVGHARNGHEAIRCVHELKPDTIILDVQMSGENGISVLKSIRQCNLAIRVIILTNYPRYRDKCINAGADFFFDKSNEFNQMMKVVENLA